MRVGIIRDWIKIIRRKDFAEDEDLKIRDYIRKQLNEAGAFQQLKLNVLLIVLTVHTAKPGVAIVKQDLK